MPDEKTGHASYDVTISPIKIHRIGIDNAYQAYSQRNDAPDTLHKRRAGKRSDGTPHDSSRFPGKQHADAQIDSSGNRRHPQGMTLSVREPASPRQKVTANFSQSGIHPQPASEEQDHHRKKHRRTCIIVRDTAKQPAKPLCTQQTLHFPPTVYTANP